MSIITVGIDLAKNVFAVHGVNEAGRAELVKPKVARDQLLPLIANLPPCLIGMEACSGAHHWARQFRQHGHTVRLIAPKFVTPYRMSGRRGKNDAADAAAICEAVTRPNRSGPNNSDRELSGSLAQPMPLMLRQTEEQAHEKDEKESRTGIQGQGGNRRDSGRQDTGGVG